MRKKKLFLFLSPLVFLFLILAIDFIIWGVQCIPTILFISRVTDIKPKSISNKFSFYINKGIEFSNNVEYINCSFCIPQYYNYELRGNSTEVKCFIVSENHGKYVIINLINDNILSYNYLKIVKNNLSGINLLNQKGIFNDYTLLKHIKENPDLINLWYRPFHNVNIKEKTIFSMGFSLALMGMNDFSFYENSEYCILAKYSNKNPYPVNYFIYSKNSTINLQISCLRNNTDKDNLKMLYSIANTLMENK